MSQKLHLKVHGSLVLRMLICLVLKTPLVGLVSSGVSVVVLLVASGTTLFPEVLSGNKFCVASGNFDADWVFVASSTSFGGAGNLACLFLQCFECHFLGFYLHLGMLLKHFVWWPC